jgi:translation initiation factor IF-2
MLGRNRQGIIISIKATSLIPAQAASAHSIGKVFVPSQNPRPQKNNSITPSGAPAHVVGKVFIPSQNPQPQENKGTEETRASAQVIGKVFVPSEHPPHERPKTETAASTRVSFQRNTTNQAPGKFTISRPDSQPSAWSQKVAFGNAQIPKSNQAEENSAEAGPVAYKPIGIDKSERSIFRMKAEPAPELVQRNREDDMEIERAREERQRMRTTRFAEPKPEALARFELSDRGKKKKGKSTRRRGMDDDEEETVMSAKQREKLKAQRKAAKAAKKASQPTPIFLPEYISVAHLATALKIKVDDLVYKMEELGYEEMSMDHVMGAEDAGLIAQEYNFEPIVDRSESEDLKAAPLPEDPSILPPRPPVVTIMGHVDHGKTTILDYLRKSSVAATEHGGITQHIGAFSVTMPSGKIITFLDTPGHAAFLSMRQRGANVTDIVILVVAADDSVKPQTIEAINHAKAARVPIIVAINKVDKEEKNIDRVKQDLARHGVEIEDYGGDTQVVCVSGKTGQGMDELEDAAVTLSEILDMRADTEGQAEGWVLEASIKAMGKVATVLVRRGTLRPGDCIVAGNTWARIRVLRNEAGVEIASAGPGTPVQIDGWKEQPLAGDEVLQAPTEHKAKSVVEYRLEKEERERLAEDMEAINEDRRAVMDKRAADKEIAESEEPRKYVKEEIDGGPKQIPFLIKGDVSGSVEAVVDSLTAIGNTEIQARVLRSGVGAVSEFDIEHAAAASGYIVNFNTPIDAMMTRKAEALKVKILDHNIIYRLVDDVKAVLSEYLPPIVSTKVLGEAEVAQVFEITIKGRKQKPIAGCKVKNGVVGRNAKYRVMRNGKKIFDGT